MASELVIDDSTPETALTPAGFSTGYRGMFSSAASAAAATVPFPGELLIPRNEWQARIQEMEERKSRVSDICDAAGLKVKDQANTNFCWANAPVHCLEIMRVIQNQPPVSLSPASVACRINGFKNQGGWGEDALNFLIEHGAVPVSQWPANAIEKKYNTALNQNAALEYRVTEWWNIKPRNMDELGSCLLLRIPVAIGLNWWEHEVTAVDPVWLNGQLAVRIDNSWGESWGTRGRGILAGKKAQPDDSVAARVVIAS